jgi:hypothetical protein
MAAARRLVAQGAILMTQRGKTNLAEDPLDGKAIRAGML